MKSEVQPCQPTVEPLVTAFFLFFSPFPLQTIPALPTCYGKYPMLEMLKCHLHVFSLPPGGDEAVVLAAA